MELATTIVGLARPPRVRLLVSFQADQPCLFQLGVEDADGSHYDGHVLASAAQATSYGGGKARGPPRDWAPPVLAGALVHETCRDDNE
eukprot:8843201-Pyramimonas_sp.AAC.1